MDRFYWISTDLTNALHQANEVTLYDGDKRTDFEKGNLIITSHNLIWLKEVSAFALDLSSIIFIDEEQKGTFNRSSNIILHLEPELTKRPGPVNYSPFTFVKLSFSSGGQIETLRQLKEAYERKAWLVSLKKDTSSSSAAAARTGIVGLERSIESKRKATDSTINVAFEDLQKLMVKAKDMVRIANSVSAKLVDKRGEISDDETIQFKAQLLSLGIAIPVKRKQNDGELDYHRKLAREVSGLLHPIMVSDGGMMTLPEAYCRINRARGFELLSPDDLRSACEAMEPLKLPIMLRTFDETGVLALQLRSHDDRAVADDTLALIVALGTGASDTGAAYANAPSMSPMELAERLRISLVIAQQRLLTAEQLGLLCRDDSMNGLRFLPNYFLSPPTE